MCKEVCENESGCNAIMTTNGGRKCQIKKCPFPVVSPDQPYTGPGETEAYYISGNYEKINMINFERIIPAD